MEFKKLMTVCLLILGILLMIEGFNVIFSFMDMIYIPIIFWLVACFTLGVGFCRYCIND